MTTDRQMIRVHLDRMNLSSLEDSLPDVIAKLTALGKKHSACSNLRLSVDEEWYEYDDKPTHMLYLYGDRLETKAEQAASLKIQKNIEERERERELGLLAYLQSKYENIKQGTE